MKRTQIYLSREEDAALAREARASGRTKSQLIREAIDRIYLEPRQNLRDVLEETRGAWRGHREDGEAFVERMRSGRLARLHGVTRDPRR